MATKIYKCQVCKEQLVTDSFAQEAVCKFCGQKHTWQFKKGEGFTWMPETASGFRYQKAVEPEADKKISEQTAGSENTAKRTNNSEWWKETGQKADRSKNPQSLYEDPRMAKPQNNGMAIAVVIIAIFIFSGILLFYILNAAISAGSESKEGQGLFSGREQGEILAEGEEMDEEVAEEEVLMLPESQLWQAFANKAFGEVTDEEAVAGLEKIKYLALDLNKEEYTISYSFEDYYSYPENFDDGVITYTFNRDLSYAAGEFSCFPGLTKLELAFNGLEAGCLFDLPELAGLICSYSYEISEIAAMVNPQQLKELKLTRIKTLDELAKFRNLQRLYIYRGSMTDLNKIASLTNLISLELDSCDDITNFSGLNSLTNLQSLSLECDELKDISFIENMPELESLSVKDSKLISLEPIRSRESITFLSVTNNREIMDYAPISTLTNLTGLELKKKSSQNTPDLGNLQNLTELSVSGVSSVSFLRNLSNVEKLILSNADITDTGAIGGMPNLRELKMSGIYGEFSNVSFLTKIPNLTKLDISGVQLYGTVTEVFQIPSLEVLILNDCTFGMNPSQVSPLPSLKSLYLNNMKFYKNIKVTYEGPITMLDYDNVDFQDYAHFIANFENLEILDVGSTKLYDLAFLENLHKLKKVNISDNYITDISILTQLKDLEEVWYSGNPIAAAVEFSPDVIVHD